MLSNDPPLIPECSQSCDDPALYIRHCTQVVYFTKEHEVYRVFGGPSSNCGYWWTPAPDPDYWNKKYLQNSVSGVR